MQRGGISTLTIKAPIELTCSKGIVPSQEAFYHRITGNYELMTARIEAGDLLLAVTTPPEIYLGESGLTTIVNNTRVQNRRETSLEVINNLINRIALTPQVQMTYQDRVYITDVLNRLGIQNVTQFMNQVFRLKQETETTEQLISLYWNHLEDLTRIVQEYQTEAAYTEVSEENIQEQFRFSLYEEILKRLQTGSIYQILNNFRSSQVGTDRYITREELQITEQKRLAANILLNQLKNVVGGGDVPFIYHHENYYENHMPEESQITDTSVSNQITSAVLLNLVDNLYLNCFEKMMYEKSLWLHLEHSFYQSAENTLWRLKNEMNHWFSHTSNREYRNMTQEQTYHQELQAVLQLLAWNREETELPGFSYGMPYEEEQVNPSHYEEADIQYPFPEKATEETDFLPETGRWEEIAENQTQMEHRIQQYFNAAEKPWKAQEDLTWEEKRQIIRQWQTEEETLPEWKIYRTEYQAGSSVYSEEYFQSLMWQALGVENRFSKEIQLKEVVQENRLKLERRIQQYLENFHMDRQGEENGTQGWPILSSRLPYEEGLPFFSELWREDRYAGTKIREKTESYPAQNLEYQILEGQEESVSYTTNADYRQWLQGRQEHFRENVEHVSDSYPVHQPEDTPSRPPHSSAEPEKQVTARQQTSHPEQPPVDRHQAGNREEAEKTSISSERAYDKEEQTNLFHYEEADIRYLHPEKTLGETAFLPEMSPQEVSVETQMQLEQRIQRYFETVGEPWKTPKVLEGEEEKWQNTGRWQPEDEALSAWKLHRTQDQMGSSVYSEEYLRYLKQQALEEKSRFFGEKPLGEVVRENRMNLERYLRQYLEYVRIEQQRQKKATEPQGWPRLSARQQSGEADPIFQELQKEAKAAGTAAEGKTETYFTQNLEYRIFEEPEEPPSYMTNADYRQWLKERQEHFYENVEQYIRYLHHMPQSQAVPYELIYHMDEPENGELDAKEPASPEESVEKESREPKAVTERWHDRKTEDRFTSLSRFEKLENQNLWQVEHRNQILTQDYAARLEQLQEIHQENQNIELDLQDGDKHTWLIHQEERQDTVNQEENLELLEQKLRQVREQNYKNFTQYQQYVQQYSAREEKPGKPSVQRIQRESLKALQEPEEFLKEYREAVEEEQKQGVELRKKIMQVLPKESRRIYERMEQYQNNPEPAPDGQRITKNNMGLLLHDLRQATQETEIEIQTSVENQEQILELSETVLEKWGEKQAAENGNLSRTEYSRNDVSLIHKTTENYIDEEILAQLFEQNRLNRTETKVTGQTDEERSEIHKTILGQTRKTEVQENQDITELIQNGVRRQLGIISDQVYSKLEKRLQNEKKRRGY